MFDSSGANAEDTPVELVSKPLLLILLAQELEYQQSYRIDSRFPTPRRRKAYVAKRLLVFQGVRRFIL